ncbi:DUF4115 domain-containing protein [Aquincola sp. S2]|uniref:DUF4115 domain-containing protein n=1 Tax=Pseudaquabacterium terrae TaxID=2732868 RepID=A0ABX2EJ51_9BURK|nr:RodZ domain-containing protein [Aquabacterium terrae]NRF68606.1 DUF4115 domain-containing protein [Aquabacterium terrae]
MSEPSLDQTEAPAVGAGALIRAARQRQGLHIAALAASIKVAPAKLEALEAGRYDELPDATFARALAQSVCRVLKIDAQPVLAQLPSSAPAALDKVDNGLNTPFRERPARMVPTEWLLPRQPALWLALLLLVAAAAFVLAPNAWWGRWLPGGGDETQIAAPTTTVIETPSTTPATSAIVPAAPTVVDEVPASAVALPPNPLPGASVPASVPPAVAGAGAQVRAVQASWIQAVDGRGQTLLARTLQAGETFELVGPRPYRLRIGNVRGTELLDRGQSVDLASRTRDNVLNIELP